MTRTKKNTQPSTRRAPRHGNGFTLTEVVVAASLLVAMMATIAPLTVRSGRLWQDSRHLQLAMDELSNQMELLISLTPDQREAAMAKLAPSDHLLAALPEAVLNAESVRDQDGVRIVLKLSYGPPQPRPMPVTLIGWLDPMPEGTEPTEDTP